MSTTQQHAPLEGASLEAIRATWTKAAERGHVMPALRDAAPTVVLQLLATVDAARRMADSHLRNLDQALQELGAALTRAETAEVEVKRLETEYDALARERDALRADCERWDALYKRVVADNAALLGFAERVRSGESWGAVISAAGHMLSHADHPGAHLQDERARFTAALTTIAAMQTSPHPGLIGSMVADQRALGEAIAIARQALEVL